MFKRLAIPQTSEVSEPVRSFYVNDDMHSLEKFLIMLAVFSVSLFYFGDKKTAGVLVISLVAMTLFYALGTYFLLQSKGQNSPIIITGLIITGLVFGYATASILMFSFRKMTGDAALVNNGIFLGATIIAAVLNIRFSRNKVGYKVLWRAIPLLLVIAALALSFRKDLPAFH